ncbi:hypothetical protein JCM10207_001945 [Rhodosporidiobolus poonsookiae]
MYLRLPRMFFFVLTTCLCIVEIGLAAWSVARAHDLQHEVKTVLPGASLNVTDAIAVGGAVSAASAVSALLCFILLGLTILRPRQAETIKTVRIKEGIFAFILIFFIATLIPATYYTANKSGVISSSTIPDSILQGLIRASGRNLAYSGQTPIISYLVVGWIAFLSTAISLVLVSIAARKTLKYGPDGTGAAPLGANRNGSVASTVPGESRPSMTTTNEKAPLGNTTAERMA